MQIILQVEVLMVQIQFFQQSHQQVEEVEDTKDLYHFVLDHQEDQEAEDQVEELMQEEQEILRQLVHHKEIQVEQQVIIHQHLEVVVEEELLLRDLLEMVQVVVMVEQDQQIQFQEVQ